MGICQSKKSKGSDKQEAQEVTDVAQLKIGKSDFITSNNGKFKDHY